MCACPGDAAAYMAQLALAALGASSLYPCLLMGTHCEDGPILPSRDVHVPRVAKGFLAGTVANLQQGTECKMAVQQTLAKATQEVLPAAAGFK
jgi:hypothetical protein